MSDLVENAVKNVADAPENRSQLGSPVAVIVKTK